MAEFIIGFVIGIMAGFMVSCIVIMARYDCGTEVKERRQNMTLIKLQKILGDRVEISLKTDFTPEQRQEENAQSALIMGLAKQMINNADIVLRTEKMLAQAKNLNHSYAMDLVAGDGNDQ